MDGAEKTGGRMMPKPTLPVEEHMDPGHMGCPGCGACLSMRIVLKALGKRTILSVPACCWAVMPGVFPYSNIKVPMLYTAFECTGASISGIRAALTAKGINDVNVVGFAGDGGTLDIGIQALSGAVERREDVIYICYDNEAYMNTGIQRSSSTPVGAWTTTTPAGRKQWKSEPKKHGVEIMVAHQIPYTAVVSPSFPEDMVKKLRKAASIKGPKYIQIYSVCPAGWRTSPDMTIELGRLAVETCAYPLYEVENGVYKISRKPKEKKPIEEYLKVQGRFRHLEEKDIEKIQKMVDRNWEILLKKEEVSKEMSFTIE